MTVCIAAICDEGKYIVVAADRMFTSPLNIEFETVEQKIERINDSCVALAAGATGSATEVLDNARENISGTGHNEVPKIAENVKVAYSTIRNVKAEETHILPMFGQDFAIQRANGMTLPVYLQTQQGMYNNAIALVSQFNLNLEILVAGIDEAGAHLFHVGHPGTLN